MHICTVRGLGLVHVYIGFNSNHCYEIVSTIKYQLVFVLLSQRCYLHISQELLCYLSLFEMYFQSLSFKIRCMFKVMRHLCLWSAFGKVRVNSLT